MVVPVKPVPSSAHRVPNVRANPRKVGVRDLTRWTGRRRTDSAANRKANDSVIPNGSAVGANVLEVAVRIAGVEAIALVGASALAERAVNVAVAAGAKRSQLGWYLLASPAS